MSKKTNEMRMLENALNALAERAQKQLGLAGAERAKLLGGTNEIEITKEWLTKFAEVHIDLGAASAVMHVVHSLQEIFGIADPFAEFNDPNNEGKTDAEQGNTEPQ